MSADEPRYTMEQAIILGRRALCESSDTGHRIEPQGGVRIRNWNGTIAEYGYGCRYCDLIVDTRYPSFEEKGLSA